jgi:hypothetical protein
LVLQKNWFERERVEREILQGKINMGQGEEKLRKMRNNVN